jgi:hypothetical protein
MKLQVPGPCSLARTLTRAGVATGGVADLAQALGIWLAANARECESQLAQMGVRTLITVDEPDLAATGLRPIEAVRAWLPLARTSTAWALHVCGPPPWPIIAQSGAHALFLDVPQPVGLDHRLRRESGTPPRYCGRWRRSCEVASG